MTPQKSSDIVLTFLMSLFVFEYPCLVRAICNYWNDLSERRAFQPRGGHFSLMSIMPGGAFLPGLKCPGRQNIGGGHFSLLHRRILRWPFSGGRTKWRIGGDLANTSKQVTAPAAGYKVHKPRYLNFTFIYNSYNRHNSKTNSGGQRKVCHMHL